jgi:hypothetical protein
MTETLEGLDGMTTSTAKAQPDCERIEITPEMIEAGVDELLGQSKEDLVASDPSDVVRWIFEAMIKSAPKDHGSIC